LTQAISANFWLWGVNFAVDAKQPLDQADVLT
jgi:hypothetical protein